MTITVSAGVWPVYRYWQKRGGEKTSSCDDEASRIKLFEDRKKICVGKVTPDMSQPF